MVQTKQTVKAAPKKNTARSERTIKKSTTVSQEEAQPAQTPVPFTPVPEQRYIDLLQTKSVSAVWDQYLAETQDGTGHDTTDIEAKKYLFIKHVIRGLFAQCPVVTYVDHVGATTCRYFDGVLFEIYADPTYCTLKNDAVTYFLVAKKDSQFERFTYENIQDGSYVKLTFEDDEVSMGFLSRIIADLVRAIGWKLAWVSSVSALQAMETYDVETDPVAHRIVDILGSIRRKEGNEVALQWSSPTLTIQDGVFVPKDTRVPETQATVTVDEPTPAAMPVPEESAQTAPPADKDTQTSSVPGVTDTYRGMPVAVRALYRKVLPQASVDVLCAHYQTLHDDVKDVLDAYLLTVTQGLRMQQHITAVFKDTKQTRKTDSEYYQDVVDRCGL